MVVVLPAPLGAEQPEDLARGHLEVDALAASVVAVDLCRPATVMTVSSLAGKYSARTLLGDPLADRTPVRYGRGSCVRRAALPHELLLPRRREPRRGAGRRSRAPRARGPRRHRPRRLLRHRPLRRRGQGVGLPRLRAELTLGLAKRPGSGSAGSGSAGSGTADPPGEHLVVLAEGPVGHAGSRAPSARGSSRGRRAHPLRARDPRADAAAAVHLAGARASTTNDSWFVLTGCRKGRWCARSSRRPRGRRAATWTGSSPRRARPRARRAVGPRDPLDRHRNDALAAGRGPRRRRMSSRPTNVHYATSSQRPLATALAAVRARRSLDELDGWLPAAGLAHLRSPAEQLRRFARWPGAVERTVDVARACAFDLRLAAPNLPDLDVPAGHTTCRGCASSTRRGAVRYTRSRTRTTSRPGTSSSTSSA